MSTETTPPPPPLTFHPAIESYNGTAPGSVTARDPTGKMIDSESGNWLSAVTRRRFARRLAGRLVPVPPRDPAEPDADYRSRAAAAEDRRDTLAVELTEQLVATVDEVGRQIETEDQAAATGAAGGPDPGPPDVPYATTPQGIVRLVRTEQGGTTEQRLTNFRATIAEEVLRDDGVETEYAFAVEARVGEGPARTFEVPAGRFGKMEWVAEKLAARAFLMAGRGVADHARAAIQSLSAPAQRTVYAHTGWREVGGRWVFLTAGGAIGADGLVPGVHVDLPGALALFHLPDPPTGPALVAAVRASLSLLDVADWAVTLPFYAALWRAALGSPDLGIGVFGRTGSLKSSLVAPFQQHLGPQMDKERLPTSWASTANAIEVLASAAKDVFFVVDEYKPTGIPQEDAKLRQKVDQVVRGGVNGAGRARLTHDIKLRAGRPPRCLVVMTGEEIPNGESLRARMVVVEIKPGDVDKVKLAACQRDARAGVYAAAMAGYLRWLAPRYADAREGLPARVEQVRDRAAKQGLSHARTPEQVASLAVGLGWFLSFAVDCGAVTAGEAEKLNRSAWQALCRVAAGQSAHLAAEEPTARFVDLLSAAVASGGAHLADHRGGPPANPEAWGWRDRNAGRGSVSLDWYPMGARVGWLNDEVTYVLPAAAHKAANDAAGSADRIPVTVATLGRRLADRSMIVPPPNRDSRQELTARPILEGVQRRVWQLAAGVLSVPTPATAAEAGPPLIP